MPASPYNVKQGQPYQAPGAALTATGTLPAKFLKGGKIALEGSSAITITISSPSVSDDYVTLEFFCTTAQAHIISYPTVGFSGRGASFDTATCAGNKGDTITLCSRGGVWYVTNTVGITFS